MRFLPCLACVVVPGTAIAQTWQQLPATVPISAAVFDAARHRLLLAGTDTQQRMHEWDGTTLRERQDELAGQKVVQHLLWDQAMSRVLALSEDRWVGRWDGGAWSWSTGGTPPPTGACSVAFDPLRRRLAVVTSFGDVHEWDGQTWWAIGNAPALAMSVGGAFAFDPITQRCLFYGGSSGRTSLWDGFAWTQLLTSSTPGVRGQARLALDPNTQRLVLYGGSATARDTWRWTGTNWIQVPTTNDPGAQQNLHLVGDDLGVLLVATSGNSAGEIWRLLGTTWSKVGYAPPGPGTIGNTPFVYDPARSVVVGFNGDRTMLFDRRWLQAAPTTIPPSRTQPHVAWSNLGQRVVLFGGLATPLLGDTWTWNGSDWEARQPSQSPSPRIGAAMVADATGGVMLFGGTDGPNWFGDQWHWHGSDWQPRSLALMPAARAYMLATYDPTRNQSIVTGGHTNTAIYVSETWIWNGASWSQPPITVPALGVTSGFRPSTGRVVVMGHNSSYEWTGSDWLAQPLGHGQGQNTTIVPRLASHLGRGHLLQFTPPIVRLLTYLRATTEPFGTSCSVGPAPALAAIDLPALDTAFAIELTARAPAAPSFLVVGLAAQNVPLGNGCRSLVGLQLAVNVALTDSGGIARFPIAIPDDPSLRGVRFTAQGAAWNPAGSPLGSATLTSGLLLTIGD